MAWGGQPLLSRVVAVTNKDRSLWRRYKGVPREAAKVLRQVAQRKRCSLWEWTLMLPLPRVPLSGQAGLWQNALWGSMGELQREAMAVAYRQDPPWASFWLPSSTFTVPWGATCGRSW